MAKIEQTIVDGVVDEMEASEVPAAPQGTTTLHGGGPGVTASLNYAPGGRMSRGAVQGQHENSGTRPLAGDFVSPTGATDDADSEQAREDAFKVVVAQTKVARAIADASFRRFCRGPVEPKGYVSGLEHLQAMQDRERKES